MFACRFLAWLSCCWEPKASLLLDCFTLLIHWKHLRLPSRAARSGNLAALSGSCSVALSLYVHLGKRTLLQLEAYIEYVLLRIAEGKGCSYEQQEAALEVVPQDAVS